MTKNQTNKDNNPVESTFHSEQRFAFINVKSTIILIIVVIVLLVLFAVTGNFN
ncbi:hypothetical protein GCM10025878_11610 [Leuconostoc gasicomitatum]|uniref:hypothetical protein n=1 Tax=Leuconostoc gasicomitatum TaxID=115778 RepID=UPI0001DB5854|nr:hypothetical protein [Leuconostoc gasicomitatum]GMA06090.1 hypothetical protein GCM10025878_11610 [Leuconostoc gasicomitatum]CBL91645.1 hypothetical protein LEGAS_0997 [Leuconostoc gasicomitatum LMG 18811]